MFIQLLTHQFKEWKRSRFWKQSIFINILLGLFILYLIANLLFIGIFIDRIMLKLFPNADPVEKLTGFIFYFLLFDFCFRFLLQKLPVISIEPYLHLPIKRSKIFNFLLFKSLFSGFNFLPLFVLIPFTIKVIIPEYSILFGIEWLFIFYFLLLSNNFFGFTLKKYFSLRPVLVIFLYLLVAFFFYLSYSGIFPLSTYFRIGVLRVASQPFVLLIPLVILACSYSSAFHLLKRNSYIENMENLERQTKTTIKSSNSFSFLRKSGSIGELILLEIKLIWRNKRPRTFFYLSILLMLYGLFVYPNARYSNNYFFLIGMGVFLTGIFLMQYGQLFFSWESSYFDRLLTANITEHELYAAKFKMFAVINTIIFFLTLPYAYYGYNIVLINLSALLYNCGVNIFLLLYSSSFNKKRISLSKSAVMNYEGKNAAQFIIVLPFVGIPLLLYLPFYFLGKPDLGILFIGLIGLLGIFMREQLLDILANRFNKKKYIISSGFREG